jgi:hypothetical protein
MCEKKIFLSKSCVKSRNCWSIKPKLEYHESLLLCYLFMMDDGTTPPPPSYFTADTLFHDNPMLCLATN